MRDRRVVAITHHRQDTVQYWTLADRRQYTSYRQRQATQSVGGGGGCVEKGRKLLNRKPIAIRQIYMQMGKALTPPPGFLCGTEHCIVSGELRTPEGMHRVHLAESH